MLYLCLINVSVMEWDIIAPNDVCRPEFDAI